MLSNEKYVDAHYYTFLELLQVLNNPLGVISFSVPERNLNLNVNFVGSCAVAFSLSSCWQNSFGSTQNRHECKISLHRRLVESTQRWKYEEHCWTEC